MAKSKPFLTFVVLFLFIGNLFCLNSSFTHDDKKSNSLSEPIINNTQQYCIDVLKEDNPICAEICNINKDNADKNISIRPSRQYSCPNLITNSEFDNGDTEWVFYVNGKYSTCDCDQWSKVLRSGRF